MEAPMLRTLTLLVLALTAPLAAQKNSAPPHPFASAAGFKCSFPSYDTVKWDGTTPMIYTGDQEFGFQVDAFDFKKGRARIAADSGAALATMVLTPTGMNVIEQTPIGNFNMTTIFVAGGQGNTYLAVNSRHNGDVSAPPRVSQNYGTCEMVP